MSRDIIAQLKSLKNHPQAGWVSDFEHEKASARLLSAIGHHEDRVAVEGAEVAYLKWNLMNFAVRPLGVSLMIFALLFGGWFTTVKAAVGSIPGDTLYGIKLITEQAQLMISSPDQRAVLHTQFAERRMVEIQSLQEMDNDKSEQYIQETVHALEAEVVKAGDALSQMKLDGGDVLTVASVLDEKINAIEAELDSVVSQNNTVSEAQQTTSTVTNSAVDAIMDVHEEQESEQSEAALSRSFKNEYTDLRERQTFDLGRIQTIGQVVSENQLQGIITNDELKRLKFTVDQATEEVADAMGLFAAGGYRTAFEILRGADATLLEIESKLVETENKVMEAMNSQVVEEVDPLESPEPEEVQVLPDQNIIQ